MTHPDELLAEYVDGALGAGERDRVEAHVASCPRCRSEVADAAEARASLSGLPEMEEPPGITLAARREARRHPRRMWGGLARAAAAAALVIAVVGGGAYLLTQVPGGAPTDDAGGGQAEQAPAAPDEGDAGRAEGESGAVEASSTAYPTVRRSGRNHNAGSVVALASDLRNEAEEAVEAGFPRDAFAFYETADVDRFPPRVREALVCAGQGLAPERSVVPFVIEESRWRGEPAWVVSYLHAPDPGTPYDRIQILVVGREGCSILHFAQQRL